MTLQQKREQIKMALEAGFRVKVNGLDDETHDDILLGFREDVTGAFPDLKLRGARDIFAWEHITENTTFEILPRVVPEFKVGQKVRIVCQDFASEDVVHYNGHVGKIMLLERLNGAMTEATVEGIGPRIPIHWLCPVVEEDDEEETNELKERLAAAEAEIADIKQKLN